MRSIVSYGKKPLLSLFTFFVFSNIKGYRSNTVRYRTQRNREKAGEAEFMNIVLKKLEDSKKPFGDC